MLDYPEDGGCRFLQIVGTCQPNYVHYIPDHHSNIHHYHNQFFRLVLKGLIKYTSLGPEVGGSRYLCSVH